MKPGELKALPTLTGELRYSGPSSPESRHLCEEHAATMTGYIVVARWPAVGGPRRPAPADTSAPKVGTAGYLVPSPSAADDTSPKVG